VTDYILTLDTPATTLVAAADGLIDEWVDSLRQLWARRQELLSALERLPRTFCHGDTTRRNLFARRDPQGRDHTVAIDWAGVGIAWIGWEIFNTTRSTLLHREVGWADAVELDRIVFDGYLEGLRDAGWRGDPRQARLGQAGEVAMRSMMALPAGVFRTLIDGGRPDLIRDWGVSMEQAVDHGVRLIGSGLDMGMEALRVLDELCGKPCTLA
jgi:hypothetical protein